MRSRTLRRLINKGISKDDEQLRKEGLYFNHLFQYGEQFQMNVNGRYFEIYDNEGNEVVTFSTEDVVAILEKNGILDYLKFRYDEVEG